MTQPKDQSARSVSRRSFLKVAGAGLGAAVVTCSGLGYLATRPPAIELADSSCGGQTPTNAKTLVAYATRAGSTGEIAGAIGRVLCAAGAAVDVRPVKEVEALDGYRAVVIGSAIRMGAWLPEAARFVETHQDRLAQTPLAYFVASGFLRNDTPALRQTVGAYLDPVRKLLEPASIALFAGKLDFSKLPWIERTLAKAMKEPEGDFRDWTAVQAWAETLAHSGFAGA